MHERELSSRGFYIETLGCQMNVYDSEFISDLLRRSGYRRVADPKDASVILVNTCSVRDRAEKKALARITELASLKRKRPSLAVTVVGCMAQRMGARLTEAVPSVDLVAGFDAYPSIPALLESLEHAAGATVAAPQEPRFLHSLEPLEHPSVTAFVTIMQGCDNYCSYCIVPYVRGRERSKRCDAILAEIGRLVALGVREVTLIGQNVNSYRDGPLDFAGLLERASSVEGLRRLRFTTSHPKDLTLGLVEAVRDLPKVCEHLHLPLQSGSDRILELMSRGYTSSGYRKMVEFARHAIPGLALTTDIMVGFPTESESDFQETRRALEDLKFDAAFMFRYSPREGTEAARLADDVPPAEKTRRLERLVDLENRLIDERKKALLGREVEILVEGPSPREPGFVIGRTRENYLAKMPSEGVRMGETVVAPVSAVTRWIVVCDGSLRKVED
jgi:tRNA-2-methylthio-N6-dimethylallyladenosine synthase